MNDSAATVKCRCGFDSGVEPAKGSFNVGAEIKRTGMVFVFLEDGESAWICKGCAAKAKEHVQKVTELVGSDLWRPISFSHSEKE